jgi:hypothetical protein
MKRSELKEAIKAEIKSVLSEEFQVGDIVTLSAGGDKLEVIDSRRMFGSDMMAYRVKKVDGTKFNANVDFPEIGDETVEYSGDQLRLAEEDLNEGKRVKNPVEELFFHADSYKKNMIEMEDVKQAFGEILRDYKDDIIADRSVTFADIREDEEPTKAEVKKEKSIAKEKADALKAQKETKEKIDKIKSVLKKNKSEVLKISKIDRKERTKAEQSLFDNMVDKTKELKKLEKAL